MIQETTIDELINFFRSKPEENYLIRQYRCSEKGCAFGLLRDTPHLHMGLIELEEQYKHLFSPLGPNDIYYFMKINNGEDEKYQQPTPKQRILAALYDIKKMQQPEPGQIVQDSVQIKQVIRYVSVPESIKELEIIQN